MLGVILFDSSQRIPVYWSPRMTREFVDGVLDVVLADRASQFSYVVGPPSLYRGNVQQSNNNNTSSSSNQQPESDSFFGNNTSSNQQQQSNNNKISNALLHSSLLCGVVESHHKIAQQEDMMLNQSQQSGNLNGSTRQSNNTNVNNSSGLMRPPHWPRLLRVKGTPLSRSAVTPTTPLLSRNVQTQAPTPLTKAQINSSKALNEGCVSLSSNSSHAWLHPSVAPCSTEPVTDWILSYEKTHRLSQEELKKERLESFKRYQRELLQQQQQNKNNAKSNNRNSSSQKPDENNVVVGGSGAMNSAEKYIPSMFHFPWRIFGDNLGIVYCIFSPGPCVPLSSNNVVVSSRNNNPQDGSSSSSSPLKKTNSFANANSNSNKQSMLTSRGSQGDLYHQQGNQSMTNESFSGFFVGGGGGANNNLMNMMTSSEAFVLPNQQQQPSIAPPRHYHHEENMPAVKQSMANLFVLLCDSFKTTKSTEAPTCKMLVSSLDQVHECVEIVSPGNGRCMPVFDTAMARKIWKMRNEF